MLRAHSEAKSLYAIVKTQPREQGPKQEARAMSNGTTNMALSNRPACAIGADEGRPIELWYGSNSLGCGLGIALGPCSCLDTVSPRL